MKKIIIIVIIVLALAGLGLFAYFYQPKLGCEKNPAPIFTTHITDLEKIDYIVPPGNVERYPDGKVLKTHSYMKGPNKVEIRAPIDSTLFQGVYVLEGDIGQYALFFEVSCEVFYLFDHVVDPPEKIAKVFPETP